MFDRKRICKNPDCMETFEPISPLADCCQKHGKDTCKNRKNYLKKLAIKALGKNASPKALRSYMVLKCLIDKREVRPKAELLKKMGLDFKSFGQPIPYKKDDTKSVFPIGNLGLLRIDSENLRIVKTNL
jgi:hypothetical protein